MWFPALNKHIFSTLVNIDESLIFPLALLIFFIMVFLTFALITHLKLKKKVGKVEEALKDISKGDPIWKKEQLTTFVEFFIKELMKAWSAKDRIGLKGLLSGDQYAVREKKLDKLDEVGQVNVIDDVKIKDILLVDVQDFTNDEFDRFSAKVCYEAVNFTKNFRDKWEEPKWGEDVDPNPEMEPKEYTEFWTFTRSGDTWKLNRIDKEWKEWNYINTDPVLEDEKYGD